MEAPIVAIGQQLRQDLQAQFDPVKVEVPQPNTGFAALDNPQPEAPVAPAKPTDDFEKRMGKVMAQAQKVQADRSAFAAEQAQHKADMAELARYRELKARAKEDPVAWAEEGGYQPDQYAAQLIEKGSLTPEKRKILEQGQELQELKSWRTKQEQAQVQAQNNALYGQVRTDLEAFASQNVEAFDLVHRTKSYDRVLSHIQDHFKRTQALGDPEILPYEQAFEMAERELEEYYSPVLESPKLRSRMTPAAVEPESPTAALPQLAQRKPVGTINKNMRAQSAPPKQLTEAERLQKAGEVLLGQMNARRG